ncbi:MAG TPA: tetratricopeptide repeat protein [Anaerolineales bacterium]|nr:tetratricopeptide repeat protein [Anaerolineales bacterium]
MKKSLPIVLFPVLLVALVGIIYIQAEVARAIQAAELALAEGDPARAAALLASVAEKRPELWEQAGDYALQGGDPQTAMIYLQNAQAAGKMTGTGYLVLGDVYQQSGDTTTAIHSWQTALENGAPPLEVHYRFLEVHRAAKDYPAAIEDLRAIVQLSPNDAQARYQLGLLLVPREPDAALVYLVQAAELDETFSEAVNLLQRSLRPSPETDDPAYTLLNAGRALASLGEWELAAEAFSQAVVLNPGYAEAWAFWGEAKGQLGQDGLAELEIALSLNPESLIANLLYALYQKRNGKPELALVYLHAAATLEPDNPAIQAEIGGTLNELGDFNTALEYYQTATELAPRDPTYWNLLAQFVLQNNTLVEEVGLAAARQALILDPDDPVALDLIGFGYYLLGDFLTAQRFLLETLEIAPDDPRPWFHLGLVFLALGENQQARVYFIQAVDLDPSSATANQAMRVLARYFP